MFDPRALDQATRIVIEDQANPAQEASDIVDAIRTVLALVRQLRKLARSGERRDVTRTVDVLEQIRAGLPL